MKYHYIRRRLLQSLILFISIIVIIPSFVAAQFTLADSGVIYGTTDGYQNAKLITVNKDSGNATIVYNSGLSRDMPGIAITSDGQIFTTSQYDELYRFDADSARTHQIAYVEAYDIPAIAFNYKDELYGIAREEITFDKTSGYSSGGDWILIKIDTATAEHEVISTLPPNEWSGMAFDPTDGNIYASTENGLIYIINPIDGDAAYLGDSSFEYGVTDLVFDDNGNLFGSYASEGYGFALIEKESGEGNFIGYLGNESVLGLASRNMPITGPQLGANIHIDFNTTIVNSVSTKQLILWNLGTETLTISDISSPEQPFTIQNVSLPIMIEPDSSYKIDVSLSGTEENDFNSELTITSNDPDNSTHTVFLTGYSIIAPEGWLFGIDGEDGILLIINTETGESDTVAFLEYDESELDYITEIEFRDDGILFIARGDGYQTLYTFNPLNDETRFIGYHPSRGLPGLDFSSDGELYAAFYDSYIDSTYLVIVEQDDASFNIIGQTGYEKIRGLTFSPDGNWLYGVGPDTSGGDTTDVLLIIDPETGIASKVGPTGFEKIAALEFGPDSILYGGLGDNIADSLDGGLITINQETGEGIFVGLTGATVLSGLTFFPSVNVVSSINNGYTKFPFVFSLDQNYPNPFNPSTTIKFNLEQPGFVSLKIYNIIGQLVQTIVSEEMAAGVKTLHWNAGHLASGVYFYKLQAGNQTEIKKAILIK